LWLSNLEKQACTCCSKWRSMHPGHACAPGMPLRFLLYSLREYPGLFLSHMRHGPGNNSCCSGLLHIPVGGCHFQRSQTPKAQPPHVAPVDMHTTRPLVGGLNEWEPISIAGIRPSKGVSAPIPCGNTHACFHKPTFPLATLLRRLILPIYSFIPLMGIPDVHHALKHPPLDPTSAGRAPLVMPPGTCPRASWGR
jgi:hypothetical protein